MAKTTTKMTMKEFAETVIDVIGVNADLMMTVSDDGEMELMNDDTKQAIIEKADNIITGIAKKAEYAKNNPTKKKAGGAGEKTQAHIAQFLPHMGNTPETAICHLDLTELLGETISPLNVANAMKFVENAVKCDVVRTVTTPDGLTQQRKYKGYYLG